ncbi:NAD(P)-binding protein [Pholiota conissans]|uniref:NAD(P)-binding protein n=1 Tax=Pholiota conissans TaxID=109636 RepID=A0A9P6D0D2_9AGAR|nr:NAD(P)-binding protein [Pholiota conissans]
MFWSRKFDPEKDLADLTGKVIIVTGANTGIGYATAKHLARNGAKVYIGSRSEEKGKAAVSKLQEEGIGLGEVVYLHVDLSTPALADQSAQGFLALESKLDILVNNAALIWDAHKESATAQDGITEMMMTNHIGTFQFTKSLLPVLTKTAEQPNSDVRIIIVSSNGHRASVAANPKIQFSLDMFKDHYTGATIPTFARYSVSKLANTLFANTLARRLSSSGIITLSLHPGFVDTSISTNVSFPRLTKLFMSVVARAPDEGAWTSCFAAASPIVRKEADKYNGSYLEPPGKITKASDNALDVALQDQLWEVTEKYLEGQTLD